MRGVIPYRGRERYNTWVTKYHGHLELPCLNPNVPHVRYLTIVAVRTSLNITLMYPNLFTDSTTRKTPTMIDD